MKNKAVEKIEKALGDMKPGVVPEVNAEPQRQYTEPKFNSSERDLGYTYIALGYIVPESTHPDHYALDVLNALFSEMESSRLQQVLKEQKKLITRGGSVVAQLNDFGAFQTVIVVDPEKRNEEYMRQNN